MPPITQHQFCHQESSAHKTGEMSKPDGKNQDDRKTQENPRPLYTFFSPVAVLQEGKPGIELKEKEMLPGFSRKPSHITYSMITCFFTLSRQDSWPSKLLQLQCNEKRSLGCLRSSAYGMYLITLYRLMGGIQIVSGTSPTEHYRRADPFNVEAYLERGIAKIREHYLAESILGLGHLNIPV